jgi:hypothetical protein
MPFSHLILHTAWCSAKVGRLVVTRAPEKTMFEQNTTDILTERPRIDELREGIRTNRVNFPVPVPIFFYQYRSDVQWRLVELYFVHGWSCKQLAGRYSVTPKRIQQSLQAWVSRAITRGYLQEIPQQDVSVLPRVPVARPVPVFGSASAASASAGLA